MFYKGYIRNGPANWVYVVVVPFCLYYAKARPDTVEFYWLGRVPCRTVRIVGIVVGVDKFEDMTRFKGKTDYILPT